MSEWPLTRLGEVADVLVGYAFKSSSFATTPDGPRLLRGTNIHQGYTDWSQEARWPAGEAYGSRYELESGDVVLAMDRPWIEAGLKRTRLREADLPALLVQRVARLRGTVRASTSFIHHTLATETFSKFLQVQVTGATVPHISQSQIESYELSLPPLREQDAICFILDAIDDLIENNRRRVGVLEEVARAIYREWFVNFRYPDHECVSLVDSALGTIPKGWAVGSVDAHLVLQRGFDLPTKDRAAGSIPVMGASGIQGSHDVARASGPGVTTGRSGTVGVVNYIPGDFWPLNTSLWVREFRLATPRYAYFLLGDLDLRRSASGAAVPTLDRKVVHALPAVCPPADLVSRWDAAVLPLFNEGELLRQQASSLAALRDLLLPKLVTGQIHASSLDLGALLEESAA